MANQEQEFKKFMEELGPGPSAPAPAPASPRGPAPPVGDQYSAFEQELGSGISTRDETAAAPPVGMKEDLARSALAGFGRGTVGLAGLPGDVESLIDLAREKVSGTKPGARYFPTSEEMIGKAEALHPMVKEALSYKPQPGFGQYVKSATEFVPGALIGPGGLGAKVVGGLAAGAATQAAEEMAHKGQFSPAGEMALKIGASIPAYMLGAKGASLAAKPFEGALMPKSVAAEDLAKASLADLRASGKYASPEGAAEALRAGEQLTPAAVAGTQTKKLLENAAQKLPPEELQAFTEYASKAAENAPKNTMKHIDTMFGRELSLSDELDAAARRIAETNDPNYKRVMAMPELQSVGGPEYNALLNRVPPKILKNIFENMQIRDVNPAEMGLIQTPKGFAINPEGMPLRFWDELKKGIDSEITGLKDITGKPTKPDRYTALSSLAGDLRTQLNKIEPYKAIRNEAADLFGVRDWTQLGEKYLTMGSGNMQRIRQIEDRLSQAKPERKMDFATGLAAAYKDMLENKPDKALALFKGADGQFNAKKFVNALAPLGENAGYELIGKANAEMLNRNIAAIRPPTKFETVKSQYMPFIGGAAGGLVDLLMQPFIWSGSPSAIMTSLAGMGIGKLYSMKEVRKARELLELSTDPAMGAKLGKMLTDDPNARSFMTKTIDFLSRGVKYPAGAGASMEPRQQQPANEPAQVSRQGRASGGRIQGLQTADMLMRAAHRAKLRISKDTEQILDQPDETVVKALDIASKHI